MTAPPATLTIRDYPQLALIAWSRWPDDVIAAEEAFGLYESNWRFVDVEQVSDQAARMACAWAGRTKAANDR